MDFSHENVISGFFCTWMVVGNLQDFLFKICLTLGEANKDLFQAITVVMGVK